MEKEYLQSIDNFVCALINTRYLVDEQEMWDQLWAYVSAKVNRMRAHLIRPQQITVARLPAGLSPSASQRLV